jgi:hypothetical protein
MEDAIDDKEGSEPERGPASTPGGNKQEAVEDRPNVSTVKPEDYPADDRREVKP